jgi:hypothetical protein
MLKVPHKLDLTPTLPAAHVILSATTSKPILNYSWLLPDPLCLSSLAPESGSLAETLDLTHPLPSNISNNAPLCSPVSPSMVYNTLPCNSAPACWAPVSMFLSHLLHPTYPTHKFPPNLSFLPFTF